MLAALLIGMALLIAFAPPAEATFPGKNGDLLVTERTRGHNADDSSWSLRIDPATGDVTRTPICEQRPDGRLFTQPGCSDVGPPAASPDGQSIAFAVHDFSYGDPFLPSTWRLRVLSLASGEWKFVPLQGASLPYESTVRWRPGSSFALLGKRNRILLADPHGGEVSKVLARGTAPDVSGSGRLVFVRGRNIYVRQPGGSVRRLAAGDQPSWSPQGSKVAFVRKGWIYTVRVSGGPPRRLTRGFHPVWSPDGRQIAFFHAIPGPVYFGQDTTYLFALNRRTGRVRRVSSQVIALPDEIPPNGLDWHVAR
jgi:Tol biopolymer transport system component